jgi:hypothetical protein
MIRAALIVERGRQLGGLWIDLRQLEKYQTGTFRRRFMSQ